MEIGRGPNTQQGGHTMSQQNRHYALVTVFGLALLVLAPLQAGATSHLLLQLCQQTNCPSPAMVRIPPKIDSVFLFSDITPGGTVALKGVGFGITKGQLLLTGLKRHTGVALAPIPLTILEWKGTFIGAKIPTITAVKNQQAKLQVKTHNNLVGNEYPVNFRATQDIKRLPRSDVNGSCSTEADRDHCAPGGSSSDYIPFCYGPLPDPDEPVWTFKGVHWTCVGSSSGTDSFSASVKNDWTFDHTALHDMSGGQSVTMSGFQSGVTSMNVSMKWNNANVSYVHYGVNVYVVGPKGVPHK